MRMSATYRLWSFAIIAVFLGATFAHAGSIPVQNASFEYTGSATKTDCGGPAGCWYTWDVPSIVPGWTPGANWDGGQMYDNGAFSNYIPDGKLVLWSDEGSIFQVVGAVTPDVTYTLGVEMGYRNDTYSAGLVQLLIGDAATGTWYTATGIEPTPGNWSTLSMSYLGIPSDVGKDIAIVLTGGTAQTVFDDVQMSDSTRYSRPQAPASTPEPASLLLFGSGLLGLSCLRKRAKVRSSGAIWQDEPSPHRRSAALAAIQVAKGRCQPASPLPFVGPVPCKTEGILSSEIQHSLAFLPGTN